MVGRLLAIACLSLISASSCVTPVALHSSSDDHSICEEFNHEALASRFPSAKTLHLVFFASWCQTCADKLRNLSPQSNAVVALFDERDRAEQVIKDLNIKIPCFFDRGYAATLGIRSVPATLDLAL